MRPYENPVQTEDAHSPSHVALRTSTAQPTDRQNSCSKIESVQTNATKRESSQLLSISNRSQDSHGKTASLVVAVVRSAPLIITHHGFSYIV